jgi:hypothetical protein
MAMRQWPKFPSKEVSCRDETQADMVAIHQPVLKSTTSAGLVALVYGLFRLFGRTRQTRWTGQTAACHH